VRRSILALIALLLALPVPASAHEEREVTFPSGEGSVPAYRTSGPRLLVCKGSHTLTRIKKLSGSLRKKNLSLYEKCRRDGYRHIQEAIDAVRTRGTRILVLPGVYREQPTAGSPSGACAELNEDMILSYEQHVECPHVQNLITILGDGPDPGIACDRRLCDLQVEGTARQGDVVVDNRFRKLNAIRADRADGVYFRNFTVQNSEFNSLYVIETDGFAIDRVTARWNDEYGFLTFASDHGLYTRCEAYGNGDGGLYPGSAADHHGARPAIEIRHCDSHHNALGYSGTAGNGIWAHDNTFHHNSTGASMDSFFPDHPGLPQDSAVFERNRIHSNNEDYYRFWRDGTCDDIEAARARYPEGVVCPVVPVPVGTGILLAGGNDNLYARNHIYDNWRFGTMQFGVPAAFRDDTEIDHQFDTSHGNRYLENVMGVSPGGSTLPNGLDFWWDIQGTGNCWDGNVPAEGGELMSDPPILPDCGVSPVAGLPVSPKQAPLVPCAAADAKRPDEAVGCDWFEAPPPPQ